MSLSKLSSQAPEQALVENMVKMRHLDEYSILRNLECRFTEDEIYTYVGTVLIAINPFRMLPLYTPDILDRYSESGTLAQPPHVFAVADRAFRALLETWKDQSIIVSGESGAGKTESTKLLLEYLMEMSRRSGGDKGAPTESEESEESLEELCLYAQTILEAFGNAKTIRNDNSSRFGKWFEVYFSRGGHIQGAVINTYLLEKSRVVTPEEGERNFHIFYELLAHAATNAEIAKLYSLGSPSSFHYLAQSSVSSINGVSDAQEFVKLTDALTVFQISKEDQANIWRIIAAILHLGNITFKVTSVQTASSTQDGSLIENPDVAKQAASLLKIPYEMLEKALLFHSYGSRSLIYIPYKPQEAQDARDALSKALYAGIFNFLGQRINMCLSKGRGGSLSSHKTIGVLDIFGFEILQTNSFEQLCINFCNERLQSHFNEECFRIEQEEYRAEGVQVEDIPYKNNQPCVDLLEQRPTGIFAMIEEEINTPGGSEKNLLSKMFQQHKGSEYLARPTAKEGLDCFKIDHYAGNVVYKSEGLMDKSRDALHADFEAVMKTSADEEYLPVINQARIDGPLGGVKVDEFKATAKPGGKGKKAQPTLGTQFCLQLNSLMKKLNSTKPHFIKCLKPNMQKQGGLFVAEEILCQLQYTGIVGLCKIRQIGYPERMPLEEFYLRYCPLCYTEPDAESLIMKLAELNVLKDGLWCLGHTKLLMKHEQSNVLSEALEAVRLKACILVQKYCRGWYWRRWLKRMVGIRRFVKDAIAKRDEKLLAEGLEKMDDLPSHGEHLPEKAAAKQLLTRLREEKEAAAMLQSAITARDMKQLEAAISLSKTIKYETDLVKKARELLTQLELEAEGLFTSQDFLRSLYDALVRSKLVEALEAANKHGYDFAEVRQARGLLARMDQEADLLKKYEQSLAAKDLKSVDEVLAKMTDIGMELPPNAKETLANLEKQVARKSLEGALESDLEKAVASRDVAKVEACLQKAVEEGLKAPCVDAAKTFLHNVKKKKEDLGALMAVIKTLEVKMAGTGGIVIADLEAGQKCLKQLASYQFTQDESAQVNGAQQTLRKGMAVHQCVESMHKAISSRDYNLLSTTYETAVKLEIQQDIVEKAQQTMKEIEAEGPQLPTGTMAQILEIARNTRWRFDKYGRLRTREQFAKGKYMNRKKTMETMFSFSKEVIPNSMIDLPSQTSKVAVNINKCLLAFCGVRRSTYPAASAQALMDKGKAIGSLRDEIFVQVCKHLTDNTESKTAERGWMLLCMCIDLFSPSVEFELYLLNFVAKYENHEEWKEYARYCLRRLEEELDMDEEALADSVHQKQVPSIDYITQ
eukprot:gene3207-4053_t